MAKILIIDDDPLMYELYELMLSEDGHEVVVAKSGQEGVEQARKAQPQLILLDIMMPKLNGLDVLDQLHNEPQTALIPVIAFSNLVDATVEAAARKKGAVRYAIKSQFQSEQLRNLISEVLSEKGKVDNEVAKK